MAAAKNPRLARAGHKGGKVVLALYGREHFVALAQAAARARGKPGPPKISAQRLVGLRPDQDAALTRLCASQGTSRSALVREAVDHWLQRWEEACASSRGKVRVRDLGKKASGK